MDHTVSMHVVKSEYYLGSVESCPFLTLTGEFIQKGEKFATRTKLHTHVPMCIGLEREVQPHNIRVVGTCQNLPFSPHPLHAVVLEDQIFADFFHGTDFFVLLMTSQINDTEGSLPN